VDELLTEAARAVNGPRGAQYGTPEVNLGERTARLFTAYLADLGISRPLDGRDVSALMILVKVARLQEGDGDQRDSWQDIAGYAATGWRCSAASDQ
jgi:hypothetical protein